MSLKILVLSGLYMSLAGAVDNDRAAEILDTIASLQAANIDGSFNDDIAGLEAELATLMPAEPVVSSSSRDESSDELMDQLKEKQRQKNSLNSLGVSNKQKHFRLDLEIATLKFKLLNASHKYDSEIEFLTRMLSQHATENGGFYLQKTPRNPGMPNNRVHVSEDRQMYIAGIKSQIQHIRETMNVDKVSAYSALRALAAQVFGSQDGQRFTASPDEAVILDKLDKLDQYLNLLMQGYTEVEAAETMINTNHQLLDNSTEFNKLWIVFEFDNDFNSVPDLSRLSNNDRAQFLIGAATWLYDLKKN